MMAEVNGNEPELSGAREAGPYFVYGWLYCHITQADTRVRLFELPTLDLACLKAEEIANRAWPGQWQWHTKTQIAHKDSHGGDIVDILISRYDG